MSAELRDALELIVRLAYQFGPFLFAVLFILVVARSAHRYNVELSNRMTPPTSREVAMYQYYFIGTATCGILLVFISVGWWMYSQTQSHVYEFVILDLKGNQYVEVAEAYQRNQPKDQRFPGVIPDHDMRFVLISDRPFVPGQVIKLQLVENNSGDLSGGVEELKRTGLEVRYIGDKLNYFRYQEKEHILELASTTGFGNDLVKPIGVSRMTSITSVWIAGHD